MTSLVERLKSRFIVIDGPDGAGKSTQLSLLADWLTGRGTRIIEARDPGGTAVGDRIRDILLDKDHREMAVECELMLYMASRAQLVREVIRPAMKLGKCVLCDRYVSATVAYQGAGGLDVEAIRSVGRIAVGGLLPDLTLILDVPAEQGLARLKGSPDRMEAKDLEFHRRVREAFLRQAADQPERFAVVDAAGPVEQVQVVLQHTIEAWTFE